MIRINDCRPLSEREKRSIRDRRMVSFVVRSILLVVIELIVDAEIVGRRLPSALIIGAKKAGTRALLDYLCLHARIVAAGPEVHFFDRYYQRGVDWYR